MSYSKFNIEAVKKELGLTLAEDSEIFATTPEIEFSDLMKDNLKFNVPLALKINTEKARSELIVSHLLVELKRQLGDRMSLFSGREFNVDEEKKLTGYCDFIISRSPEQLVIEAPVLAIVEAKNDNIQSGLGQCIAAMYAAQIFNDREQNGIDIIYGAVTTGTNWKFMKLVGRTVEIDVNEYFLSNVGKIMGILRSAIEPDKD